MKKLDLGQTLGILANIGVIAGIIFLAFELQQNNELLAADASFNRFNMERGRRDRLIENRGGLGEIAFKKASDQPLTEFEAYRHAVLISDHLESLKWQFGEIQAGRLPEDSIDLNAWRFVWLNNPELGERFNSERETLDPDFVNFIEANIVNK